MEHPPLVGFDCWAHVLEHVRAGKTVWYKAPLDSTARLVRASAKPKGRTVRIKPWAPGRRGHCAAFDAFSADVGHLDRFRR